MSLVDYASSDDDGGDADMSDRERDKTDASATTRSFNKKSQSVSHEQPGGTLHSLTPSFEKLPDASLLLNSPDVPSHLASCSDHSSRVAAAMAENASRKRKSRILASSLTRSKVPRGTLPHSKKDPETAGGVLLPPQLKGRSNVVTEDISKLFVKGRANPSSA